VREAGMAALRRYAPKILEGQEVLPEEYEITLDDFMRSYEETYPSALREIYVEIPNIRWKDVGGLEDAKRELRQAIEWPLKYPKLMKKARLRAPKGILLEGPPGCGKTLLAKAVATESGLNFISIKGPEFLSKWVGESERGIREYFKKARLSAPCILFFDDIDSIAPRRGLYSGTHVIESVLSQLLTELDGIESLKDVIVMAATNRPELLDPAILRPGRFDKIIHVGKPDERARLEIYKIHTRGRALAADVKLEEYAKLEGYTGADIEHICDEAARLAVRDFEKRYKNVEEGVEEFVIKKEYFDRAIKRLEDRVIRLG
jgi:transitional endoplasmic reticulum ATPase